MTSSSPTHAAPEASTDTGLIGLVMMARLHGIAADPDQLAHEYSHGGQAFSQTEILLASKKLGLKAKAVKVPVGRLLTTPLPALAHAVDGSYFILARAEGDQVLIQSPTSGRPERLSLAELRQRWTGELILFASRASLAAELGKFDFTWFIPAVVKYRKLLLEVLLVSFVLQLFALVTPLFFQVVMDKVLVHRGFTTLDVIAVGLLVVTLFEVVLTGLRGYVFAHTTSRIDVELGARLFRHLLNLPMAYFEARRVGDSVARVRELENIRAFLTGNAVTVVLDLLFSVVFLAVMSYYSWDLTLIVLVSLPCYVLLSLLYTPMLRGRLHEKFNRGAENQGARLVIDGELSVGQLIAFNMLAGHVAQPVMRLSQLWTDFQQTGISMQRLGDILNTRNEAVGNKSSLPPIQGRISFDQVLFRYQPDGSEVLRGISLDIKPGEVIGIVGRSGSGKSTLAQLVQRLYVPERGRVLVDGLDLALADVSSLRRQIGVVLQENVLFNRSIRDNIALTDPGAPLPQVIAAAKLAGAHDFILELSEAYDTLVGEHGSTLSGGQRQRIAIARALIANPRILIFDEATSALDYESERIIQANMKAICQNRTVIIIAHRLSAVRDAHRIVVLDKGQIIEQGSHAELLQRQDGHYAYLHRLQMG